MPRKKSDNVRRLFGPDHAGPRKETPKLRPEAPKCPSYLPAEGKQIWNQVVAELNPKGVLATVDGPSLEAYCMSLVVFRKAARQLTKSILRSGRRSGEIRKHPAAQIMRESAQLVKAFAREFGLTPLARESLSVPELSDDELEDILTPKR